MSFISFFLQQAGGDAAGGAMGSLGMLIPLILVILIMYFLMIRPQNKKQKETEQMIANLKKGDKVITIGGIHGVVSQTKENTVVVKVDDGTKIEFNRTAISTVVVDKPAAAAEAKPEKKGLFGKKAKKEEAKAEETVKESTEAAPAEVKAEEPAADADGAKKDE